MCVCVCVCVRGGGYIRTMGLKVVVFKEKGSQGRFKRTDGSRNDGQKHGVGSR